MRNVLRLILTEVAGLGTRYDELWSSYLFNLPAEILGGLTWEGYINALLDLLEVKSLQLLPLWWDKSNPIRRFKELHVVGLGGVGASFVQYWADLSVVGALPRPRELGTKLVLFEGDRLHLSNLPRWPLREFRGGDLHQIPKAAAFEPNLLAAGWERGKDYEIVPRFYRPETDVSPDALVLIGGDLETRYFIARSGAKHVFFAQQDEAYRLLYHPRYPRPRAVDTDTYGVIRLNAYLQAWLYLLVAMPALLERVFIPAFEGGQKVLLEGVLNPTEPAPNGAYRVGALEEALEKFSVRESNPETGELIKEEPLMKRLEGLQEGDKYTFLYFDEFSDLENVIGSLFEGD